MRFEIHRVLMSRDIKGVSAIEYYFEIIGNDGKVVATGEYMSTKDAVVEQVALIKGTIGPTTIIVDVTNE